MEPTGFDWSLIPSGSGGCLHTGHHRLYHKTGPFRAASRIQHSSALQDQCLVGELRTCVHIDLGFDKEIINTLKTSAYYGVHTHWNSQLKIKYSWVYLLNKYIVHLMNSKVGLLQIDERR